MSNIFVVVKGKTDFPVAPRRDVKEVGYAGGLMRSQYDGVTHLVEPYSLVFKQRQDGAGHAQKAVDFLHRMVEQSEARLAESYERQAVREEAPGTEYQQQRLF